MRIALWTSRSFLSLQWNFVCRAQLHASLYLAKALQSQLALDGKPLEMKHDLTRRRPVFPCAVTPHAAEDDFHQMARRAVLALRTGMFRRIGVTVVVA